MRSVRDHYGLRASAKCAAAIAFIALLACNSVEAAETRAYLLRGWFGVFSTGMDGLADELKTKGIKAQVAGHLYWSTALKEIVRDRAAGKTGPIVLVGHSQGANNVIDMARSLEKNKIPVDLLVTLAPFMQDPVPANVVRAVNFYQSPGWGAPLTTDRAFHGKLSNINVSDDWTIAHVSIDKSARIHAEISREIVAAVQAKEGVEQANPLTATAPQSSQKTLPPQAQAQ
jgi:alpha-beta hydrolase superfamily lysophospholipase